MKRKRIKEAVKKVYSKIAKGQTSCCASINSCCSSDLTADKIAKLVGYDELSKEVPSGSNLGLGCGNPVAFAEIKEGEIVLDLGCGAGFDCFIASKLVGESGKVIGVDMTPAMIEKASKNAKLYGYRNVEFRLGEIEKLPLPNDYVDAIISNCVINLSLDKALVFKEAYRVLKPNGRLVVSDIVWLDEPPESIRTSLDAYISCIGGALKKEEYINCIKKAGFDKIEIVNEFLFGEALMPDKLKELGGRVASITIKAIRRERNEKG